MEKLVRVRAEQDDSITAANKLLEKGYMVTSIIPYKGGDYRNQFLFLLALPPEDEERERWDTGDEDDEDDEDDDKLPFNKGNS